MISSLSLKEFTVFRDIDIRLSRGLNVFVGANGTGKSHLLKLMYASLRGMRKPLKGNNITPTKVFLEKELSDRLVGVFQPDSLGRLTRRSVGRNKAEIDVRLRGLPSLGFSFSTASKERVALDSFPSQWLSRPAVFLPTRELLSIYPNFLSTYETTAIPFEETWRDLAVFLGKGIAKGVQSQEVANILHPLEEMLGGKLILEGDRFYCKSAQGKVEMHLLAEGLRKIGTIARLVANRTIEKGSYLFWDEPEANLNAEIIRGLAFIIMKLVQQGIQVFIATHSLFLLRELYLLQARDFGSTSAQYFGLQRTKAENSFEIGVVAGDSMEDIGSMALLDYQTQQDEELLDYLML